MIATLLLVPAFAMFEPFGIFTWLLIGLIAGAIASRLVRGRGMGCVGDIVVGILGAFVGSFILSLLHYSGSLSFLATVIVSILGAVVLLALLRLVSRRR
jgi:uncharacterized membrane protein YeaQ/YmgE (transglycosylase-associated protein family)